MSVFQPFSFWKTAKIPFVLTKILTNFHFLRFSYKSIWFLLSGKVEIQMNLPWHHTFLSLHLSATFTIRLPSDSTSRWTPLSLAVSFPLLGRIRDFHPLETCAARRTIKKLPARQSCRQKWYHFILLCNNQNQHIHQLLLLHNLQASFLFP